MLVEMALAVAAGAEEVVKVAVSMELVTALLVDSALMERC